MKIIRRSLEHYRKIHIQRTRAKKIFLFRDIEYLLEAPERRIRVSGEVHSHEALIIKGPSGSGKTTLLRVLGGLKTPESGMTALEGIHWTYFAPWEWKRFVHYVPQKPVIFPGTFRENLEFPFMLALNRGEKNFSLDLARTMMKQLLLPEALLDQQAGKLSVGEAARMNLVRSVLFNPSLLLLDEPASALDEKSRDALFEFLKNWLDTDPVHGLIVASHGMDPDRLPGGGVIYLN
jgi:putative ABC transport system ATP-binding protein